jgi:hypothetical protein
MGQRAAWHAGQYRAPKRTLTAQTLIPILEGDRKNMSKPVKSATSRVPETGKHKRRFFVYMVESPSDRDAFAERSEQRLLKEALALDGIHCVARTVLSRETFDRALSKDLILQWKERAQFLRAENRPMEIPVVHISAHGDDAGIQLSNRKNVLWKDLGNLLGPFNARFKESLLLCLSSCQGFAAKTLAYDEDSCPFAAIVGHEGEPFWSDAAVGYSVFYHLLNKGVKVKEAVAAMCRATADPLFKCQSAKEARLEWRIDKVLEELFSTDADGGN